MIKNVKEPKCFRVVCPSCKTKFEFELEDIEIWPTDHVFDDTDIHWHFNEQIPKEAQDMRPFDKRFRSCFLLDDTDVRCPHCREIIDVSSDGNFNPIIETVYEEEY